MTGIIINRIRYFILYIDVTEGIRKIQTVVGRDERNELIYNWGYLE